MRRWGFQLTVGLVALFLAGDSALAYPADGYAQTGIRRLERLRLIVSGKMQSPSLPAGARRSAEEIKLHLLGSRGAGLAALPQPDPGLQRRVDGLFPDRHASYALALLDITPGSPPRLALRQADQPYSPGSVGKLAIAAGLFRELKAMFPDAPGKRQALLRTRMVTAGKWIHTDHHNVPLFDPQTGVAGSRPIREGDVFSLYEWTDHMLSASANAAASTVWKELMLMRRFGGEYPPPLEKEREFFENTPRNELKDMAMSTVNDPLREMGIDQKDWQLGSFFTAAGQRLVPGGGGSSATALGFLRYLVALEQGRISDEWSSLEIKRLMYMTARRIRYASSPALNNAAVYFKSGSLFHCRPEPDFKCGQYMGNLDNYMNSVAIVEQPDGRTYLVALMSNVLRKNSAVEHQTLATLIDRILAKD